MLEKLKQADIPQELVFGWPRSVLLGDEKLIVEQHLQYYRTFVRRGLAFYDILSECHTGRCAAGATVDLRKIFRDRFDLTHHTASNFSVV